MKHETKVANAILFLLEAGYSVTKAGKVVKSLESEPVQAEALTILEFVETYKVGRTILFEEIKNGRLKTYRVGRRRYISRRAAEEWQAQRQQA